MPNLIVTTCGTSLLTNGVDLDLRRLLVRHANAREQDLDGNVRQQIDRWAAERLEQILQADDDLTARLVAELNGLLAYYRSARIAPRTASQDRQYLVVTDTYVGVRASECVAAWIKQRLGQPVEWIRAGGLNTSDIRDFRAALADIARNLDELDFPEWRRRQYHVAFNLTGGFKSVNGFMQTLGTLLADECFYLFEASCELMRVPRLPIRLDAAQAFEDNLSAVRRMANRETLVRSECGSLPETLLFVLSEDEIQLSEWGHALWMASREEIYGSNLMDPLTERLRYSNAFVSQVRARKGILVDDERLHTLNCRLDDLALCLSSNGTCNPNRLDFKAIKGNPIPGCTHEFDVWSDDGHRGYGCYDERNRFVVEKIGCHL